MIPPRLFRALLSVRRLTVTFGVALTMGSVEWLALGHPIGLIFGVLMGLLALFVAPVLWLWLLPWGRYRSTVETTVRGCLILGISSVLVCLAYLAFFSARDLWVPHRAPLIPGLIAHLSSWSAAVISIPLFGAAGWGMSRHLELERRLEVRSARETELQNALEEARLLLLMSRLDPHFLFNALNLVAELCRDDPVEAEQCVIRLSSLLRSALEHGQRPLVSLRRELDLCTDYLELCRSRFGARLSLALERSASLEHHQVPLFAVQALCENAVRHGIERSPSGGCVSLALTESPAHVVVEVRNPGPFRGPRPGGLGLDLTRRRLALAFGSAASLTVTTTDDGSCTVARLVVPRKEQP